jgi:hypothetical protein
MVGCLCFAPVFSFISLSLSSLTFRLLFARYSQSNRHGIALFLTAELSSISLFYSRRYVFCLSHCLLKTRWSHLLCRFVLFELGVRWGSCLSLRGMPFYWPVCFTVRWNRLENEFLYSGITRSFKTSRWRNTDCIFYYYTRRKVRTMHFSLARRELAA